MTNTRRLLMMVLALWMWFVIRAEAAESTSSSFRVKDCQLTTTGNRKTLQLQFSLPPSALRTHTLPSPSRIIIDAEGPTTTGAPVTYPLHDALLWRVRVGFHPQRLRVVLDLKDEQTPHFEVTQHGTSVTVEFDAPQTARGKTLRNDPHPTPPPHREKEPQVATKQEPILLSAELKTEKPYTPATTPKRKTKNQANQPAAEANNPPAETPAETAAPPLTLVDAIALALEQSPTLHAAQQQVAGTTAQVMAATANFLPKLDVEESYTRSDNPTFAFSAKLNQGRLSEQDFDINRLNHPGDLQNFRTNFSFVQPLYTGGRASLSVAQARLRHQASEQALTRQQQEVMFQVATAYYGVLLTQERLTVVQSALQTATANARFAQDRFDTGLMVESDALSAQVRLAALQEQDISAQQHLKLAYAALNDAMGLPLMRVWTLQEHLTQKPTQYPELTTLEAQALNTRSDYAQLGAEEQAAERGVRLAKAAFFPTLNATAQYDRDQMHFATDGQDSWFVGVVFQWNLFNGRADRAKVDEARAQLRQIQAQRARLASQIQLAVKDAFFHLRAAEGRIDVAKTAVTQAEAALRIITDRYQTGLSTIVDLLGNETALTQARGNLAEALHDQLISRASLELAVGTISAEGF